MSSTKTGSESDLTPQTPVCQSCTWHFLQPKGTLKFTTTYLYCKPKTLIMTTFAMLRTQKISEHFGHFQFLQLSSRFAIPLIVKSRDSSNFLVLTPHHLSHHDALKDRHTGPK